MCEELTDEAADRYTEDEYGFCEMCSSPLIPYVNDYEECSACHSQGCTKCMERGDDVFPWLCGDCF